jgi:hypothetical protein
MVITWGKALGQAHYQNLAFAIGYSGNAPCLQALPTTYQQSLSQVNLWICVRILFCVWNSS